MFSHAHICTLDMAHLTLHPTGYNMAKNLRAKIPQSDTLIIRDVNEAASKRFVEETQTIAQENGLAPDAMKVLVAQSPRELAEQSVSTKDTRHWI